MVDYAAWFDLDDLTVEQGGYLWAGVDPPVPGSTAGAMPAAVAIRLQMLQRAVTTGKLRVDGKSQLIWRGDLEKFAEARGERPFFLFGPPPVPNPLPPLPPGKVYAKDMLVKFPDAQLLKEAIWRAEEEAKRLQEAIMRAKKRADERATMSAEPASGCVVHQIPAIEEDVERHFASGFTGEPVESAGRLTHWTVPMCCAWIATRDVLLVAHLELRQPDSKHWLAAKSSPLHQYDSDVLAKRTRFLVQAGHEGLPSIGAALFQLRKQAASGFLSILGKRLGRGEIERIQPDEWANLRIVPTADGYQAQAQNQQYSSPWFSSLCILEDEVRKVWPEVPADGAVVATGARSPSAPDIKQSACAIGAESGVSEDGTGLGESDPKVRATRSNVTDQKIATWIRRRRRELQAMNEKHGRNRLIKEAAEHWNVPGKVVRSIWAKKCLGLKRKTQKT